MAASGSKISQTSHTTQGSFGTCQRTEIQIKISKTVPIAEDDKPRRETLAKSDKADVCRRGSENGRRISNSGGGTDVAQFNMWKRKTSVQLVTENDKALRRSDFNINEIFNTTLLNINKTPLTVPAVQSNDNYFSNKQTKTLGTLVPNEIINKSDQTKKDLNTFVGVLLFADVSGFTALCEKYNNTGKGGTYHLTATLNGYIGAMVDVIYLRGGDVLKFSGDAFLAIWKVGKNEYIYNTIHEVVSCAMHIQSTLGTYKTDVKVFLKVKLAISVGNVTFCVIGDSISRHYLLGGSPIQEVKAAEHACVSGDVVMSSSAWGYCSPANYEHIYADESNVKIIRILYDPSMKKRQLVVSSFLGVANTADGSADDKSRPGRRPPPPSPATFEGEPGDPDLDPNTYVRSLRVCVDVTAVYRRLGAVLRPFMIPPVAQQIDADQPLEFLTEMRQVTTVFINIQDMALPTHKLLRVTDRAYCIVCKLMRSYMGCVNKVSLFDKDIMMLCIFGLRGYKHELESHSGLRCAYRVWKELSCLEGVRCVSVGVTTGMCYCGVVGHPLRREYTVIGVTVNKAARIMCAYPGKVTCDQTTYVTSKLPSASFVAQEPKPLKGITTVGNIYEYTEVQRLESDDVISLPLLGRTAEIEMFRSTLTEGQHRGILVLGEAHVGKTRLLQEFVTVTKKLDYTTVFVSLDSYHVTMPHSVAYLVMKQVLGLEESSTSQEREQLLGDLIGVDVGREWLCYLNAVMQVQFPNSLTYIKDDAQTRCEITRRLYQNLIMLTTEKLLICIDNFHYIDSESWHNLLVDMLNDENTFIAMTMFDGGSGGGLNPIRASLTSDYRVVTFTLLGLDLAFMAPLACQMLSVRAIPSQLDDLLRQFSHGNPGWCDNYLTSLMQCGGLSKVDMSRSDLQEMIVPQASQIASKDRDPAGRRGLGQVTAESEADGDSTADGDSAADDESFAAVLVDDIGAKVPDLVDVGRGNVEAGSRPGQVVRFLKELSVAGEKGNRKSRCLSACVISNDFEIRDVVPQNMEVIITQAFDCLPPYDQLLLKCGSVLGDTFSRSMLNAVMPNATLQQTVGAVGRCFQIRILDCGHVDCTAKQAATEQRQLICRCSRSAQDAVPGFENLPAYSFCKYFRFCIPSFRQTTYDLLPGNQRTEFHARAVRYLEAEPIKCIACGGGGEVAPWVGQLENRRSSIQALDQKLLSKSESRRRMVRFVSQDKRYSSIRKSTAAPATDEEVGLVERVIKTTESILKQTNARDLHSEATESIQQSTSQDNGLPAMTIGTGASTSPVKLVAVPETERHGHWWGPGQSLEVGTKQSFMPLGNKLSWIDFRFCECPVKLAETYRQLIEHCVAADLLEKRVEFLIRYGSVSISLGDTNQAVSVLEETLAINMVDVFPVEATREFNLGKIHSLLGNAYMELNKLHEARQHIRKALHHLGQPMQESQLLCGIRTLCQEGQFWLKLKFPSVLNRQLTGHDAELSDQVSACLATLCNIFMMEENWSLAKLAALRSLNHAQRHCLNVLNLATAYSNALDVFLHFGQLDNCGLLERAALIHCNVQVALQEANELSALGRLYCSAFVSRFHQGNIVAANKIGFRILEISSRIYVNNVKLFVLPLLIQAMVLNGRVGESVDLLGELEESAAAESDEAGTAWHRLLCLELLLNAGVVLQPADLCLDYSNQLVVGWYDNVVESLVGKRIVAATWLWYLRRQHWEEAGRWEQLAAPLDAERAMLNPSVLIVLLQCRLLAMATRVAPSEREEYHQCHVAPLIAVLKHKSQQVKIVLPRFLHLRAYLCVIQKRRKKAMYLFALSKQASIEQENDMEEAWVDHSIANYLGQLTGTQRDFWEEHSSNENNIEWPNLMLYTWSHIMYTLPMDEWVVE